jgi:serine/threonine-protein kinase
MIGMLLNNRYRVEARLGAGGMGEVYLAEDTRLGRKVALKILPAEVTRDEERVRRFEREARAASALNHPNILTIYEIGQAEAGHFIATEFVEGSTLRDLSAGKIELKKLLDIGSQVAEALAEAHRAGIVHRDIKPENIMVRRDGYAKLLDFGLAKLTEAKPAASLTASGALVGTIQYMSPEVAEGRSVDHRTDLFSLGSVLYEMATGKPAFTGESFLEVLRKISSQQPPPVREVNRLTPPELQRIIEKCLAKDPDERYQHADDLAVDLRRLRRGSDTDAAAVAEAPPRPRRRGKAIDSIAILPLANASADPDAEYLSDGITESLINSLSQVPKLRVMARSTVFRYKGQEVDPQTVGRDLKVGAVLTGRVVQRGDTLIIGTELVDVENGWQLWGGQYNRKLSDIFAVQEEIAKEISEKLRLRLTGGQKKRLTRHHTENAEAYQAYLKGLYYWNKFTEEGLKKSIEHFRQAIEIDPNYALAYAGLAHTYHQLVGVYPPGEVMPKAKAAAVKALELDGTLAEAHAALGWVRWRYDWDWPEAERAFKRANELNPNYAIGHGMYAMFLDSMGRFDESSTAHERARQLDPLSLIIDATVGLHLYLARRYDEAIERCRKTIEMDPNFFVAHARLGLAYEQKGMFEEAIAEFQKAITLSGGNTGSVAALGRAYALAGNRVEAQKVADDLTERSKREYIPPHSMALLYAGLGEPDQAFAWLEEAYEARSGSLSYLKVDPALDSLRSDPRFQDLLQRVGLAP